MALGKSSGRPGAVVVSLITVEDGGWRKKELDGGENRSGSTICARSLFMRQILLLPPPRWQWVSP